MNTHIKLSLVFAGLTIVACHTQNSATAEAKKVAQKSEHCDHEGHNAKAKICETRTINIEEKWTTIDVHAHVNGDIAITGWDKDHMLVSAKITAWDKDEASAKELLSQVRIETGGETIRADGPKIHNRGKGFSVDFEIKVPQQSNLELKAVNGDISIDNASGNIEAKAVNGGVHLANLGGDVEVDAVNGSVTTALTGATWQGHGLSLSTINGSLKVTIPKNYSADLETKTLNGSIDFDFPVTVEGKIRKKTQTKLGTGGPKIELSTVNGSLKISQS